jgi:hypothetical protein
MTFGLEYEAKTVTIDAHHGDFLALLWRHQGTKAAQQRTKTIAEGLCAHVQLLLNQPSTMGIQALRYRLAALRTRRGRAVI